MALSSDRLVYCRRLPETFRAVAPGRISRELMTKSPTQVMVRVTTTATAQLNSASCCHMRMPRLRARAGWIAERVS